MVKRVGAHEMSLPDESFYQGTELFVLIKMACQEKTGFNFSGNECVKNKITPISKFIPGENQRNLFFGGITPDNSAPIKTKASFPGGIYFFIVFFSASFAARR